MNNFKYYSKLYYALDLTLILLFRHSCFTIQVWAVSKFASEREQSS